VVTHLFGGVELAFIDHRFKTRQANDGSNEENITETVDMDAYGLYVGGEGSWEWCKGFDIFGRASIGALVGSFDLLHKEVNRDGSRRINAKDCSYGIVSHLALSTGLGYAFCGYCGADWNVRLGYELHQWSHTSDFLQFVGQDIESLRRRSTDSLGFDGLFLSVGASF